MSNDSLSSNRESVRSSDHPLYRADGGRARRGLTIVALCALFWLLLGWLWFSF